MRVIFTYAISTASPPATSTEELCGDDDAFQLTEVGGKSVLDVFLPARGSEVKVFDRGNHQSSIAFVVTKLHASLSDARDFQMMHATKFPGVGVLKLENFTGGPSATQWTYIKGGFNDVRVKAIGATTVATYSFTGGKPKQTAIQPDPL